MNDPFRLDGEIALITGGGTGLGLGMAQCIVQQGGRVVLVGRREAELRAAVDGLTKSAAPSATPIATYVSHDVTRVDLANHLIRQAEAAAGGKISLLINNAGIHLKKPAVQTTPADMTSVLQTHVVAAHALTIAVLPGMIERKHGVILFTASMASLFGIPQVIAYAAAKSAYLGMVRTLATEVSPHNIRVNAIAPGWIQSPMLDKAMSNDSARRDKILSRTPLGRFGNPTDIGWAAVYLCSRAGEFITGAVLPVDGGVSIGF